MIIIGNKEFEFQFTMPVWDKFEQKVGLVEEFDQIISSPGRLKKICRMAAIMSIEQPVSEEMFFRELTPADVRVLVNELRETIREGLKMETEKGEDEVVDEVLEEIEKKETQAE